MPTFNTTDPKPGYVYDEAIDTWFPLSGIAPGSTVEEYVFIAAGSETSVSGVDSNTNTLAYTAGTEQVYLNGVLLVRNSDYTASNGTSITGFSPALAASDVVTVITYNPSNIQITDAVLETDIAAKGDLFAGTAVDTVGVLTVGTNGYILSANSAQATGLEWIANDVGTVTLAGTQTLTNKTLTAPKINLAFNAQTGTTYTLVAGDSGKLVTTSNASGIIVTIPTGIFAAGEQINIQSIGVGLTTISGASVTITSTGATANSPTLRARYSAATIICTSAGVFTVIGDIA